MFVDAVGDFSKKYLIPSERAELLIRIALSMGLEIPKEELK